MPTAFPTPTARPAPSFTWPGYTDLKRFADVPAMPSGAASDGFARSWIMYLPLGHYQHPEYGDLRFTHAKLAEMKRKFDENVRGIDIALDCDHKTGEAPGWIERLALHERSTLGDPALVGKPAGLYALIRWTPLGVKLLKEQTYRYFSPEFGTHFDEVTGKKIPNVILGGALTNRPFLKTMDAVSLAERLGLRAEGLMSVKLGETSTTPWGQIDKACLPDSAFLDPKNRRLPVYEGTGPKDAKGRYTQRGPLNLNGVKAAWAAINGAHTGTAMSGLPAGTRAKLARWHAQYFGQDGTASKTDGKTDTGAAYSETTGTTGQRRAASGLLVAARDHQEGSGQPGRSASMATRTARSVATRTSKTPAEVVAAFSETLDDEADTQGTVDDDAAAYLFDDGDGDGTDSTDGSDGMTYDEEDAENGDEIDTDEAGESPRGAVKGVEKMSDTHGPVTTSKRGHQHGKYALHTHADDGDHSDAELAEEQVEDAEKMSERPSRAILGAGLARYAALLSEEPEGEAISREQFDAMRYALMELAQDAQQLQEQRYREEVTRLSEGFSREMRLSKNPQGKAQVAPSRVFRQRFEALFFSDEVRDLSDETRQQILSVIDTAYRRGAVVTTQLAAREPDASAPLPPAQMGSRADRVAAKAGAPGDSRMLRLAEGIAQRKFGKAFGELKGDPVLAVLREAADLAGYK